VTFARLRHDGWERRIFPLDEPAGSLLVGAGTLAALQGPADDVTGEIPHGVDVAFTADAVFSPATVEALRRAATGGRVVQAAIKRGTPLWRSATRMRPTDGDLRIPLWAGALGRLAPHRGGLAVDALGAVDVVAVCDEESCEVVRVPPYGKAPHTIELPRVRRLGGQIVHWLDVLELSLAALGTARTGRNQLKGDVDIHPTATVIDSILEDGVKVEPHASVINSYLGKNVLVADHSVVHSSVIGDECRSLVDTSLRRMIAMPGSTLSNLGFSDSAIGANVFLTTSVATFARPGEDIVVEGHDTGRALLGAAIGARCVLGSRALLAAGTALPPGLLVVARPEEAATKLDDEGLARATMLRGDRARNF
jgi:hypothetical protein